MSSSEAPPSTGLVAGKYQLVRMIGRGGMGSVWEARHVSLGTPSAIKFIESEYADSLEARSRFDKEAKAAATIQSKHAIQIYDHGVTDDGKPYIVMELLQGEPLDKRIERLGRMTLQDTARVLQQVSRGLARAHERGIVHRDLKPENIFLVLTPDDDEEVAKVLDFGIAKMQNGPNNPGLSSSTKTGAVLGTPFYMSPEQARGLRNVDHRTDIWSLGVIAYKCVTGKLPFDGESGGDLLVKICTAPVPVPSHVAPGLPPSFDAWFLRTLEREPERRFATVQEMAEALGYAAGVGPRSVQSHGTPLSSLPTVGAGPGMVTPNGPLGAPPGAIMTPGPQPSPFAAQNSIGARTPQPGAMTNAPFTSSQSVPGVPSGGKGKLIAGMFFGLLLVGGAGTAAVIKMREPVNASHGVGLAPPAVSSVVEAAATTTPEAPTPPDKTADTAQGATTEKPPEDPPPDKPAAKPVKGGKLATAPTTKKTSTPTPPTPPTPPATTVAAPATTPTTAPTKKPGKNDPGY